MNERLQKVCLHAYVAAGHKVVQNGHVGEKLDSLERPTHSKMRPAMNRHAGDVTTAEFDLPFLGPIKTR